MSERRVMTEYGPGAVVASETVRGLTSYKVEGQGFSIWLTAQQIPEFGQLEWEVGEDHRWDNSTTLPYNPQPQFPAWSTGESTIQPNQRIDSDERLHPADSVSFEERPGTGPGPSRDLFAAEDEDTKPPKLDDDALAPPVPEYTKDSRRQREADKYIDLPDEVDHWSLQARLDDDPARVVSDVKMANYEGRQPLDPRLGQVLELEMADTELRTAAWSDVRKKAIRLRRSGMVQLEAANPSAIVATVTGDHGIYDVAVLRGNILTGSSSITEWTCSCPWGDWAFEREHTFVGRLCSHAYAAYLELQSLTKRDEKPYGWSDKTSAREFEAEAFAELQGARYPREDGRLSTEPGTMSPDLHPIPHTRRLDRVDPQVDERTDITRTSATEHEAWYPEDEADTDDMGYGGDPDAGGPAYSEPEHGYDFDSYEGLPQNQDLYDNLYEPADPNRGRMQSAIESIHPSGWGSDVEGLLRKLKGLWEESSRPGENQARIEEIRDVTDELRSLGFDSSGVATAMRHAGIYDWDIEGFLHQAFLSEPFQGSGPVDHDSFGTSAEQVALEEGPYDDLDGPGDNPAERNGDDLMPRGASVTAAEDGDNLDGEQPDPDLAYLMENDPAEDRGEFDFQARFAAEIAEEEREAALLRTAGRKFTMAEQQALMDEMPADGIPLSDDELDLHGTHYLS